MTGQDLHAIVPGILHNKPLDVVVVGEHSRGQQVLNVHRLVGLSNFRYQFGMSYVS